MLRSILIGAGFIATLVAIHVGLRAAYINVLLAKDYPLHNDRAFETAEDVRMLLVGNSLVQLDIVPIPGTYKLATFDESYSTTYYRLRRILDEGDHAIEVVLMQLSLHSFRALRPTDTQQEYWAQIIDYPDLIRTTGRPVPIVRDAIRYRVFPYTGGVARLLNQRLPKTDLALRQQIGLMDRDFSQAYDPFADAIDSVSRLVATGVTIDQTAADYLTRIIDLCAAHNVKLVLVQFPVTRIHYEAMSRWVDFDRWQDVVDERLEGADDVEMIDFLRLYFDDYSRFMDPLHLNAQSKEVFTNTLLDELAQRGVFRAAGPPRPPA